MVDFTVIVILWYHILAQISESVSAIMLSDEQFYNLFLVHSSKDLVSEGLLYSLSNLVRWGRGGWGDVTGVQRLKNGQGYFIFRINSIIDINSFIQVVVLKFLYVYCST